MFGRSRSEAANTRATSCVFIAFLVTAEISFRGRPVVWICNNLLARDAANWTSELEHEELGVGLTLHRKGFFLEAHLVNGALDGGDHRSQGDIRGSP